MKFALTKKWKIIIGLMAALLAIVIVLSLVLVNVQFAKDNIALARDVRNVLIKTFDKTELGMTADPKRVIDNENPLNIVSYNGYDDVVKLWQSIPDKQKPYTVIMLIAGQILLGNSEKNLHNLEKWADTCEENQIPYCLQVIDGETHMEARPPIKYLEDRFAAKHEYFYGVSVSELYSGASLRGVAESDNSLYIQQLIKLCAKYGGYFVWLDTNLGYKNGIILEWLENNESFYTTFKQYKDYICLMNKERFADVATYGVMQGLWLAGLVGNWGVASDCYVTTDKNGKLTLDDVGDISDSELRQILEYSENMYVQSMMLAMSRGGTCFSQGHSAFAVSNAGQLTAGYEYAISPLLNRIIDGEITVPNREDVFSATRFAFIGRENYNIANCDKKESELYPKNGNSGIVPLLPSNLRKAERQEFLRRGIVLVNHPTSDKDFLEAYGKNDSNTYLSNTAQNWYYINNMQYQKGTKYANFTPKYASAKSVHIESEEFSSAIITDTSNGINFYISNYSTDKTNMRNSTSELAQAGWEKLVAEHLVIDSNGAPIGVSDSTCRKTVIEIKGSYAGGEPIIEWKTNNNGSSENGRKYSFTKTYNPQTEILRLEIEHNGIIEFNVLYDDSGKEYDTLKRKAVDDIYSTINADTSELKALTAEKINDSYNYTYFSYLEYDRQFEKAKTMINESIYTQKEIDKQVKLLNSAKKSLINVKNEAEILRKVGDGSSYQAATMTAFDSLLREMLSCQKYVEGRSNDLEYKSIYKNKSLVCAIKAKPKAIKKAYNNLLLYIR